MKNILISSDHNGVIEKGILKDYLKEKGFCVIDIGPYDTTISVDYNKYSSQLSQIISNGDVEVGILICGTGVGMSIVANRFSGVRAVLAHNDLSAINSRKHNNANVLCLGSWLSTTSEMIRLTDLWLNAEWEYGRHVGRVEKIDTKNGLVLTYGVFDVIHKGHIELLKFAKSQGTKLVVAIDSDERIKNIKNSKENIKNLSWWSENTGINNERDRKHVLENIKDVDEVIFFNSTENLINLFDILKPETIVKGGHWSKEEIRERDDIPDNISLKVLPVIEVL